MSQRIDRSTLGWFKSRLARARSLVEYRAGMWLGRHDPLTPPKWLDPGGSREKFGETGEEFFRYFVELCALRPDENVLDVGCGTGRMARPLTTYLEGGSYDGLEIVASSVRWCRRAYRRHPAFRFHHADLYNKEYNPAGRLAASEYRFPFADSSFDFVFLTSVFTHMLSKEVGNYLSEIARVLRPGGRCLVTYFLLNQESRKLIGEGASIHDFRHELPGCFAKRSDVPEAAVAYDEDVVREAFGRRGLLIAEPIRYGWWCGRERSLSKQDIVIASKPL
jgi:SAM-dependent methyltransferase